MKMEIESVTVDIDLSENPTLVSIWNEMAEGLTAADIDSAQLITLRQQFFLGAHSFSILLRTSIEDGMQEIYDQMLADIRKNMI